MAHSMTRGTIVWFVGSAVVGAAAGGLHLLRSELGGAHTGVPLAVGAFGLTALAAVMLFHGVMLAAREQDAAAGSAVPSHECVEPVEATDTTDPPAVYTFRAGSQVGDEPRRAAKRDWPPTG